jgi:hypothetical protein
VRLPPGSSRPAACPPAAAWGENESPFGNMVKERLPPSFSSARAARMFSSRVREVASLSLTSTASSSGVRLTLRIWASMCWMRAARWRGSATRSGPSSASATAHPNVTGACRRRHLLLCLLALEGDQSRTRASSSCESGENDEADRAGFLAASGSDPRGTVSRCCRSSASGRRAISDCEAHGRRGSRRHERWRPGWGRRTMSRLSFVYGQPNRRQYSGPEARRRLA